MISYWQVEPLEAAGMDDESIALHLSSVTRADISISSLENFLSEEGLARRNPVTGSWQGELIDLMGQGGAIGEALEELFSHLNKPRSSQIETSKSPWAEKASLLISGLFVLGKITEAQADAIYKMAGGKVSSRDVTQQDIQDARDKQAALEQEQSRVAEIRTILAEIELTYVLPALQGSQTADQVKESIKQGL